MLERAVSHYDERFFFNIIGIKINGSCQLVENGVEYEVTEVEVEVEVEVFHLLNSNRTIRRQSQNSNI